MIDSVLIKQSRTRHFPTRLLDKKLLSITLIALLMFTSLGATSCSGNYSDEDLIAALKSGNGPVSLASGTELSDEDVDCIARSFVIGIGGAKGAHDKYDMTIDNATEFGIDNLRLTTKDAHSVADEIAGCAAIDEIMLNIVGLDEDSKACVRKRYSNEELKEVAAIYFERSDDLINSEQVSEFTKVTIECAVELYSDELEEAFKGGDSSTEQKDDN